MQAIQRMQDGFSLSLFICTRHRPEDLRRCLTSIAHATSMPVQAVVSDDSDEGRTLEDTVRDFLFATYNRGPRKGLGANRNACLAVAIGSWIMFIDDDVLLPPDFIRLASELCQAHADDVLQPIISGFEFKHVGDETIRVEPSNADFWGFQRLAPNGSYRSLVINATLFPAELFRQASFDALLRYGSEEIDMARHAVTLGYRILFAPSLFVHHYPSALNRGEYKAVVDASRLYATAKYYWSYQRKPLKAVLYVLLAHPRNLIAQMRRSGLRGVFNAFHSTITACGYTVAAMRRKTT